MGSSFKDLVERSEDCLRNGTGSEDALRGVGYALLALAVATKEKNEKKK